MAAPPDTPPSDALGHYSDLRRLLIADLGDAYKARLRGLTPRYARVWCEIAFGYGVLGLLLYAAQAPDSRPLQAAAGLALAPLIGYWVAYLQLFLHEGAHYNLAPGRRSNDVVCDLLVSWIVGTNVHDYRSTHFRHHLRLGQTDDTENSYFRALTPSHFVGMLTGYHAVRILLQRRGSSSVPKKAGLPIALMRGATVHGVLCGGLIFAGAWPSAVAWVGGIGLFYPLFATLRQTLEHRSAVIPPGTNCFRVSHGSVTRIFGSGPISSTFGGAGFNRHLLHHWEPRLSYTRLAEFERWLMETRAAPIIDAHRSSYWESLIAILRNDNGLGRSQ